MSISYHISYTKLGPVLVALTRGEIHFAHFGDSEPQLISLLRSTFDQEDISPAFRAPTLDTAWIDALIELLVNGSPAAPTKSIVTRPRGTSFQRKVWAYLQTIPTGEVLTYQDVARGIGNPLATRAVASACAKNDIALLIPCHRIVRRDGSVGGYKWGVHRKRALLQSEQGAPVTRASAFYQGINVTGDI